VDARHKAGMTDMGFGGSAGMAEITAITMPKWGLTMTEARFLAGSNRRRRLPGGEELLEIETTKITNVFESSEPGRLRRIVAQEGTTLPIGACSRCGGGQRAG